jgi:hypothetical protein
MLRGNDGMMLVSLESERGNRYRGDSRRFATARAIRIQPSVFRELLARLFVQRCFVNFSAQTKRKFSRFDFLRIAKLHFDGNGADDRHPVAVIDDALEAARAGELNFNNSIS